MTTYVTFGQMYRYEPHGRLPDWACDPDGWLEIESDSAGHDMDLAVKYIGTTDPDGLVVECAFFYRSLEDLVPSYYPKGCVGRITDDGLVRVSK